MVVVVLNRTKQSERPVFKCVAFRGGGCVGEVGDGSLLGKARPEFAVLVVNGRRDDAAVARKIGECFLRAVGVVEVHRQVRFAVLAGDVGDGGKLGDENGAGGDHLVGDKREAREQQRDATGEHDDGGHLALEGEVLEKSHDQEGNGNGEHSTFNFQHSTPKEADCVTAGELPELGVEC